jgi:BMFP domain-containing protein YqiC
MALGKSYPGGDNCAMQIDTKTLDALARRLAQVVPPGLNSLGDELERNLKAVLQSSLKNLDLVTREEFEVQRGVLSRTRERLEQLQSRLAELEEGLSQPPG